MSDQVHPPIYDQVSILRDEVFNKNSSIWQIQVNPYKIIYTHLDLHLKNKSMASLMLMFMVTEHALIRNFIERASGLKIR